MPTEVKAYRCNWCKKISGTKRGILQHEERCHKNPLFNCCSNCKHATMKEDSIPDFWFTVMNPFCSIHNLFIFTEPKSERPYFIECNTEDRSYGMREEVPVPYTCHYFESKGKYGFPDIVVK